MNPSPQNGERDPRESGGFSFPLAVLLGFVLAIAFDMLVHRREARGDELQPSTLCPTSSPCATTSYIPAGTWITAESGHRVCMTTQMIVRGVLLGPGFCVDWQDSFFRMQRGQLWPVDSKDPWVRYAKPRMSEGNYLQFHTEQGWKP